MSNFQNLKVWQVALPFSLAVYKSTATYPSDERFGLTSQIRRAAVSIISNIAEGSGRGSDADKARFWEFAISSSYEVEAQLIFSKELGYIDEAAFSDLIKDLEHLQGALGKLIQYLKATKK